MNEHSCTTQQALPWYTYTTVCGYQGCGGKIIIKSDHTLMYDPPRYWRHEEEAVDNLHTATHTTAEIHMDKDTKHPHFGGKK